MVYPTCPWYILPKKVRVRIKYIKWIPLRLKNETQFVAVKLFRDTRPTLILPRAEVPRDLDIVPLPPGPFYIKIELFFIRQFLNVY